MGMGAFLRPCGCVNSACERVGQDIGRKIKHSNLTNMFILIAVLPKSLDESTAKGPTQSTMSSWNVSRGILVTVELSTRVEIVSAHKEPSNRKGSIV